MCSNSAVVAVCLSEPWGVIGCGAGGRPAIHGSGCNGGVAPVGSGTGAEPVPDEPEPGAVSCSGDESRGAQQAGAMGEGPREPGGEAGVCDELGDCRASAVAASGVSRGGITAVTSLGARFALESTSVGGATSN